jgi:hypothetical protein
MHTVTTIIEWMGPPAKVGIIDTAPDWPVLLQDRSTTA